MRGALSVAQNCLRAASINPIRHTIRVQSPNHQLCVLASANGSGETQIQPPNVPDLARMANIGVTEQEVNEWGPKIEKIVEWFGELQKVDLEGVAPSIRADIDLTALRPDIPREYDNKTQLLSQVPEKEGAFVRVPKTKTSSD